LIAIVEILGIAGFAGFDRGRGQGVRLRPWGDTSEASAGIVNRLNIGAITFVQVECHGSGLASAPGADD